MKNFAKGQKFIVVFLIAYILISIFVGLSTFSYLAPKSIKINYLLGFYALFSIICALCIYFYTRKKFTQAELLESSTDLAQDDEAKRKERLRQQQLEEANLKRKKNLEEKKRLEAIVSEISDGLNNTADINEYFDKLLINISKPFNVCQGIAYALNRKTGKYETKSTYAYYTTESFREFEPGQGVTGQVAKDKKILLMDNIPENYIRIISGMGEGSPRYLLVIPIINNNETVAVLELASFEKTDINYVNFENMLNNAVGNRIAKDVNSVQ